MDNYIIEDELGCGFYGTVFSCIDKRNPSLKLAIKISKCFEEEALSKEDDYSFEYWRQIDFLKKFNHKLTILTLHDHFITTNCEQIQKKKKSLSERMKEYIDKLNKSKYCKVFVFNRTDGILKNIMGYIKLEIDPKIMYSMVIQIIATIAFIDKQEYYYHDLHPGNIGYTKTKKQHLKLTIKNKIYKIPTFGYLFTLLDFDDIRHDKYKLSEKARTNFKISQKYGTNVLKFIFILSNIEMVHRLIRDNFGKPTKEQEEEILDRIKKLSEWEQMKHYVPDYYADATYLLAVLNRKALLDVHGVDCNDVSLGSSFMEKEDLWYMATHATKYGKIIKHFIKKLNIN